jgi:carboxyl-terminal processing protease
MRPAVLMLCALAATSLAGVATLPAEEPKPETLAGAYRVLMRDGAVPFDAATLATAAREALPGSGDRESFDADVEKNAKRLERASRSLAPEAVRPAFEAMMRATGDPHTFTLDTSGEEALIGAVGGEPGVASGLSVHGLSDGRFAINGVASGSAAAAAGLKAGDVLLAIDGKRLVRGQDVLLAFLGKKAGAAVRVTVRRPNARAPDDVTLTMRSYLPSLLESRIVDGVGVVRITAMTASKDPRRDIFSLLTEALRKFDAANVTALAIDLRGNGGGAGVSEVASLFVDAKTLLFLHSRHDATDQPFGRTGPVWPSKHRVAIVVDDQTYSAAEMVPFILQQHGAARVFGMPTGGALSAPQAVWIGGGIFFFPRALVAGISHELPPGHRVTPDVLVPNRSVEDLVADRDPPLDAALESLRAPAAP